MGFNRAFFSHASPIAKRAPSQVIPAKTPKCKVIVPQAMEENIVYIVEDQGSIGFLTVFFFGVALSAMVFVVGLVLAIVIEAWQ